MTPRGRIASFGSAALLVLAGLACALLLDGLVGELLTAALMLGGLAGAVFLLFLEVGLSEDADRAEQARRAGERDDPRPPEDRSGHREGRSRPRRPPRRRRSG